MILGKQKQGNAESTRWNHRLKIRTVNALVYRSLFHFSSPGISVYVIGFLLHFLSFKVYFHSCLEYTFKLKSVYSLLFVHKRGTIYNYNQLQLMKIELMISEKNNVAFNQRFFFSLRQNISIVVKSIYLLLNSKISHERGILEATNCNSSSYQFSIRNG